MAETIIAASPVAWSLLAHGRASGASQPISLPLTTLRTVAKVCVPGAGWIRADPGTVALFRGPGGAAWVLFVSEGESISAPLANVALKEAAPRAPDRE